MTTSITENQGTTQATAAPEKPEASKKAHRGARKPHVAPSKTKSGKKAAPTKKGVKARKPAGRGARQGNKTTKVLDLLKRSGGATLKDLMKATGWQAHSVRGFLSGTLRKKMSLTLTSSKGNGGERSYSVKA